MSESPTASSTSTARELSSPDMGQREAPSPYARWLSGTIALILFAIAFFVWFNVKLDLLGLHGRRDVKMHTLARFSGYLMAYRFIPENFDGLLVGNSVAAGYDTSLIHNHRVFNAAIRGSSMDQERAIVEEVLKRGHLRVIIFVLHTNLISYDVIQSAYMTPHDYYASFGSIQTLLIDLQALKEHFGYPGPVSYDYYGRTHFPLFKLTKDWQITLPNALAMNPSEVNSLAGLLADLHSKGVKIYAVFAPTYQPHWDAQREQLSAWRAKVLTYFSPSDTIIKVPDDVLRDIQSKPENFPDWVHMSPPANATVMGVVERYVDSGTYGSK